MYAYSFVSTLGSIMMQHMGFFVSQNSVSNLRKLYNGGYITSLKKKNGGKQSLG